MRSDVLRGKRALVTGASSGLGADFARELAGRGCHLVLVARREDRLFSLRQELVGVGVDVIGMDLAAAEAPVALYRRVQELAGPVDVLVNNAGYGIWGEFLATPWERERNMLQLDVLTLVGLTKLFLGDMVARGFGYVLQVASVGAYQPTPSYATYAAAKAFVLHFGEALSYELWRTGVRCTVLSPGPTATEFFHVAGQRRTLYHRLFMMQSRQVARIGIRAMLRGKPSVVPGVVNALFALLARVAPRRLATAAAQHAMR